MMPLPSLAQLIPVGWPRLLATPSLAASMPRAALGLWAPPADCWAFLKAAESVEWPKPSRTVDQKLASQPSPRARAAWRPRRATARGPSPLSFEAARTPSAPRARSNSARVAGSEFRGPASRAHFSEACSDGKSSAGAHTRGPSSARTLRCAFAVASVRSKIRTPPSVHARGRPSAVQSTSIARKVGLVAANSEPVFKSTMATDPSEK
mmetsp:Transcript_6133/g.16006  ORF Transcript_6133/g.16006 Transcript_6133/m.16006 type:complete len:208 (-) Transcript_6133:444-1067(-)